ncbi:MAG: hydroxyquinol 1,2-dioxygenase [Betaproteobacteria bacterium]|jgi:hydroxyquinol 1,2-dioxygenase|nr:hydroxyquinol 1,2-dioxygenase [Betaproteobacteria bacterium]
MGRQFNEDNLTAEVVKRLGKTKNARHRQIMASAVKHLHAFARDVHLTEEEWFEGIKFLTAVGQKCDDKRQEFILLSDVLGLSMMIVALNHKTLPGATEATVLGPFFAHGAKEYGYGGDLRVGCTVKGEDVWVSGRVLGTDGKSVPNAVLDIWQAKADGIYDVQEADAEFELRGRVKANAKGEYAFASYKPKFYSIPMDGPVGHLTRATTGNHMRPAHMHAIVSAPGYQQVITHVFVEGDPYLDGDAVFAVKNSLVAKYKKVNNAAEAKKLGMPNPFFKLEFDFQLSPAAKAKTKARKVIAPSDAVA